MSKKTEYNISYEDRIILEYIKSDTIINIDDDTGRCTIYTPIESLLEKIDEIYEEGDK